MRLLKWMSKNGDSAKLDNQNNRNFPGKRKISIKIKIII